MRQVQQNKSSMDLFAPVRLGPYDLRNRMVMALMTRNRAGVGNVPHELNAVYYGQRASAGLIVSEVSQVSPQGVGYPGTPGVHSREQVDGWKLVTKAVHERGGRIFLQLWHVGRISHPSLQPNGELPVAPSSIRPAGDAFTATGLFYPVFGLLLSPVVAAAAMSLSSLSVVGNALRLRTARI